MVTKLKVMLLVLIITLSNSNMLAYAASTKNETNQITANFIQNQNKERSNTQLLQDTKRNIYVLDLKVEGREELRKYVEKHDNGKDYKHYVQYIADTKNLKQKECEKYKKALNNAQKAYDYYKNKLGVYKTNYPIFILPNYNKNDAFALSDSKCVFIALGKSYSEKLNTMGHEYTHAMLRSKYGIVKNSNEDMKASIEEGICDYMGAIIEGKSWLVKDSGDKVIRDIKNPKSVKKSYKNIDGNKMKTYPDHYSNRARKEDNKEGYTNSTIVSHLLYTIQSKIKGTRATAHMKVAKLALRSISKKSSHNSIEDFAQNLYESAYSDEKAYVEAALKEVGLKPSITLGSRPVSLNIGKSKNLYASVYPNKGDASKRVKWSSSNTNVATVSGGTIKAISVGKTTITASIKVGEKTIKSSCTVTVLPLERKVSFTMQVPSNYTGKYYVEVIDASNNKVLSKTKETTGSSKFSLTYTINSTSSAYKRKLRVVTTKNKYMSNAFTINANNINKNIYGKFENKKVTVTQR